MRLPLAILAVLVFTSPQNVYTDIHHLDFRNFTYPWTEPEGWSGHLEWLDPKEPRQVTLTNGRWALPEDADDYDGGKRPLFAGLTLEEVTYGQLDGEPREAAIVVLRFDSGGTQYSYYVYVYTFERDRTHLLGYFHSGDRAYFGLSRVSARDGKLVVELFDPEHRLGDCCSEGLVRMTFAWHKGRFAEVAQKEFLKTDTPSRLPVSVFGIHQ